MAARDEWVRVIHRQTPLLPPSSRVYFQDSYDHVLRIDDSLETYRGLLSSTLHAYPTRVSDRLGPVPRGFAVVVRLNVPAVVMRGRWWRVP